MAIDPSRSRAPRPTSPNPSLVLAQLVSFLDGSQKPRPQAASRSWATSDRFRGYPGSSLATWDAGYRPFFRATNLLEVVPQGHGVDLHVEPFYQGHAIDPETGRFGSQQSCGTTSLAMMENFFHPLPAGDAAASAQLLIDRNIRRSDNLSFTAPGDLVDYANSHGYRASAKNHASLADLTAMLDQGVPVQVVLVPFYLRNQPGMNLHYAVVSGYRRDPNTGGVTDVVLSDPNGAYYAVPTDEFLREWSTPSAAGIPTGLDRYMMAMVPDAGTIRTSTGERVPAASIRLPSNDPTDPLPFVNAAAGAVMDLRNAATGPFDPVRSAGYLASALFQAVGFLLGAGPMTVGAGTTELGEALLREGEAIAAHGGPFGRLAGGLLGSAGQALAGGGRALSVLGNGIATLGNQTGNLFKHALS